MKKPLCMALLCASLAAGCASTPVDRLLPHLENTAVAESYLGAPHRVEKRPDGPIVNEWLLDDTADVPGQWVTIRVYFRGADGFMDFYEYTEWVPEHLEKRHCRIRLTVDGQGRILDHVAEGGHCEALLKRPSTY
ncbi:MAG: hypothetical protein LBB52_04800 [Desulfovibrio sp.]|jgi:hypothetical protein|nr:hypothetical protein [Desulfovibrio sp.]